MSYVEAATPECTQAGDLVEVRIDPVERDIGDFTVRRVLPSPDRRAVGPFVFFDHMGPAEFPPGKGIQVRPHPHIGLATLTYLFEGEIIHRDSLGFVQPIRPGAVNLMTAGRGIVHSERAGDDLDMSSRLHGIQSWMALPEAFEEADPAFIHYAANELPSINEGGADISVIVGSAYGASSPVQVYSPMLYLDCLLPAGCALVLPQDVEELAIYPVSGEICIGRDQFGAGSMAVLSPGKRIVVEAGSHGDSRIMVIGGSPLGKRRMWWNFVSSRRERIEKAKLDWSEGRFDAVPGDSEFIPLPEK